EVDVDSLLTGRGNISASVGPLIDDGAGCRIARPPIPSSEGYMVGAPIHLRRKLCGGWLHVPYQIALHSVRLHDKLCVIRTWNQSTSTAVLVVELLRRRGVDKQWGCNSIPVELVETRTDLHRVRAVAERILEINFRTLPHAVDLGVLQVQAIRGDAHHGWVIGPVVRAGIELVSWRTPS